MGLTDPTFSTGSNGDLSGKLRWSDGSDYVYGVDPDLPDIEKYSGDPLVQCMQYRPDPYNAHAKIVGSGCFYNWLSFVCEYDCAKRKYVCTVCARSTGTLYLNWVGR